MDTSLLVPSRSAAVVDVKVARPDSEVALPGDASPAPGAVEHFRNIEAYKFEYRAKKIFFCTI